MDKKVTTPVITFPSNSNVKKQEVREKREIQPVTKAVKVKKGLGKKILETFVSEDIENVGQYVIHDVLVPAAKNALTDMVQGGIEMLLYSERRSSNTTRSGNKSYVSYQNYSSNRGRDDRRDISRRDRASHRFDDIVIESRGEAERVLGDLVDYIYDFGAVSVADFYALVQITPEFTDDKYGWNDLRNAKVVRVRNGYIVDLPRPIILD